MPEFDNSRSGYQFLKDAFLRDTSKFIEQQIVWERSRSKDGTYINSYHFDHVRIFTEVGGYFRFRGTVGFLPEVGRFKKLSFMVIGGSEGGEPQRLLALDFMLPGDVFNHRFNRTVVRTSHWHSYHDVYGENYAVNYNGAPSFEVDNWLALANEALLEWGIAPIRDDQWDVGQVRLALQLPGVRFQEGM